MIETSQRAQRVKPSPTLAASARARELKSQGIDIVNLGAGEPDFQSPDVALEAGIQAIRDGITKYGPAAGLPELKNAIIDQFQKDQGLTYEPNQILVSVGAKHSLYNLFQAVIDPGDEVILPAPYWVSYPDMITLAGGKTVVIETSYKSDFVPDPKAVEDALTERTKIIAINSPQNPTGAGYPKEVIEELVRIAIENDVLLVSDEIYCRLVYGGFQPVSPATLSQAAYEHTMVINGVSKTYAMTGWRIGWAAGPASIIKAMVTIQSQSTSGPSGVNQLAAVGAIQGAADIAEEYRQAFERRMHLMVEGLRAIDGVECAQPKGAFYVFPYLGRLYGKKTPNGTTLSDSVSMQEYLLEEAQVSTVAGAPFGADGHLRMSFAASDEDLKKALDRIGKAIANLS